MRGLRFHIDTYKVPLPAVMVPEAAEEKVDEDELLMVNCSD